MKTISLEAKLTQLFNEKKFREGISLALNNDVSPQVDPRSSYILAACHFSIGNYQSSLTILDDLESAMSNDASYLSFYGAVCRRNGNLSKSKHLLLEALKLEPNSVLVRNNYANLLIDLHEFDEARKILNIIIELSPDYVEAHTNLSRLEVLANLSSLNPVSPTSNISSSVDFDPLLLAFSEQEVSEYGRIHANPPNSQQKEIIDSVSHKLLLTDQKTNLMLDQVRLAEKANTEKNPSFSLELCDQISKKFGVNAGIYDCVAESLILSKAYLYAEIYSLHVCLLDSPGPKQLINIFSLALQRNDVLLAQLYLDKIILVDPSNPHISKLTSQLDSLRSKNLTNSETFSFKKLKS